MEIKSITLAVLVVLVVFVSWWPLAAAAVALAALTGHFLFAIIFALLVDIIWGVPTGMMQYLQLPLTAFALLLMFAKLFGTRFFFDRNLPERL